MIKRALAFLLAFSLLPCIFAAVCAEGQFTEIYDADGLKALLRIGREAKESLDE